MPSKRKQKGINLCHGNGRTSLSSSYTLPGVQLSGPGRILIKQLSGLEVLREMFEKILWGSAMTH